MMYSAIDKGELKELFHTLSGAYTLVGPVVKDGIIDLDTMNHDDIPAGFQDISGTSFLKKVSPSLPVHAAFFREIKKDHLNEWTTGQKQTLCLHRNAGL
jgi:hypothetical protein